ncbi:hypothetical protein CHARACLAT_028858 [Characodon lateralis]|uniref:Uncharacterized protein n=1 Tax=Characodon lateralis TaxID=208331 RepID=A0ABU7DL47_9TELE|nr:hypothetical protein [Characodon lateralis]
MRLLLSFSQEGKTASETASLLGTCLGQFASTGFREKQRDISALFLSGQSLSGVSGGRGRTIGKGCFYAASGIMGSPLLQFAWLCRK